MSNIPIWGKPKNVKDLKKVVEQEGARTVSHDMSSTSLPTEEPTENDMIAVENAGNVDDGASAHASIHNRLVCFSQASSHAEQKELTPSVQLK